MEKVESAIRIDAPAAAIVTFLKRPDNLIRIWPGATSIEDVEFGPHAAARFRWTRKFLGVHFEGAGRIVVSPDYARVTMTILGGLVGTMNWLVRPYGKSTDVELVLNYKLPMPLHHRGIADTFVELCKHDARALLANLSAEIATTRPPAEKPDEIRDDSLEVM